MRIRGESPGIYITPESMYPDINYRKLIKKMDLPLLKETIADFERLERMGRLMQRRNYKPFGGPQKQALLPARFLNIVSASLKNENYVATLVSFAAQYKDLTPYIVLEMSQSEFLGMDDGGKLMMSKLNHLGFSFSMDTTTDINLDINALSANNIRFVKLDSTLIIHAPQQNIISMVQSLKDAGIAVIAEKIENQETLRNVLELGVDFGQGHYFGKPDFSAAYHNKALGERA